MLYYIKQYKKAKPYQMGDHLWVAEDKEQYERVWKGSKYRKSKEFSFNTITHKKYLSIFNSFSKIKPI